MARAEPIHGLDPKASLAVNAAVIIRTRLDEVLAYKSCLTDSKAVYELHQMRIAAKRLRYTMELFKTVYEVHPSYSARFSSALETVKALQDHLGFMHDADVLVPQLTEHLTHLLEESFGKDHRDEPVVGVHFVDFDACIGLLTLCHESRAERDARFASLLSDWVEWEAQAVFSNLIVLLEEAAVGPPPDEPPVAPEETAALASHETPTDRNETADAEIRPEPTKTVRPRAEPRRRRPLDAARAAPAPSRRHPRAGADTPARPPEGGTR